MNSAYQFQTEPDEREDLYGWIAPIYDPMVGLFLKPLRNSVLQMVERLECGRILDIACGTGEQARILANNDFTTAGVDLSPAMLKEAKSKHYHKASFFMGDAEALPFLSESFDCALISLAVHEMQYPSAIRVVNEALRVLASGGRLIIFDYVRPDGLVSTVSLALLQIAERIAGEKHFRNFKVFMNEGGLNSFLQKFPVRLVHTRKFMWGAAALIAAKKTA